MVVRGSRDGNCAGVGILQQFLAKIPHPTPPCHSRSKRVYKPWRTGCMDADPNKMEDLYRCILFDSFLGWSFQGFFVSLLG